MGIPIKPTEWGWKIENNKYVPIQFEVPVAPDHILKFVRCKCKGSCSTTSCSCRKHGLHCVSACSNCYGCECTNVRTDVTETNKDDSDDNFDRNRKDIDVQFIWDDLLEYY